MKRDTKYGIIGMGLFLASLAVIAVIVPIVALTDVVVACMIFITSFIFMAIGTYCLVVWGEEKVE
ncbi:MAG: hypothetical protein ACTSPL_04265 [Candidatus Odinarchaeia archaeon]